MHDACPVLTRPAVRISLERCHHLPLRIMRNSGDNVDIVTLGRQMGTDVAGVTADSDRLRSVIQRIDQDFCHAPTRAENSLCCIAQYDWSLQRISSAQLARLANSYSHNLRLILSRLRPSKPVAPFSYVNLVLWADPTHADAGLPTSTVIRPPPIEHGRKKASSKWTKGQRTWLNCA